MSYECHAAFLMLNSQHKSIRSRFFFKCRKPVFCCSFYLYFYFDFSHFRKHYGITIIASGQSLERLMKDIIDSIKYVVCLCSGCTERKNVKPSKTEKLKDISMNWCEKQRISEIPVIVKLTKAATVAHGNQISWKVAGLLMLCYTFLSMHVHCRCVKRVFFGCDKAIQSWIIRFQNVNGFCFCSCIILANQKKEGKK